METITNTNITDNIDYKLKYEQHKASVKKWKLNNKDAILEYRKKYYEANKDKDTIDKKKKRAEASARYYQKMKIIKNIDNISSQIF